MPAHIPILLLANFADQGHHRQVVIILNVKVGEEEKHVICKYGKIYTIHMSQVTQMQIADFVERFSRPGEEAAEVRRAFMLPNTDRL